MVLLTLLFSLIALCTGFELLPYIWDSGYRVNNYLPNTCYLRNANVIYFDIYKLNYPLELDWAIVEKQIIDAYTVHNNMNCNNIQLKLDYIYDNTKFDYLGDPCNVTNVNYINNNFNRLCFDTTITDPGITRHFFDDNYLTVKNIITKVNPYFGRTEEMLYNILVHEFGHVNLLDHSKVLYTVMHTPLRYIDNFYILSTTKHLITKDDIYGIANRINRDRFLELIINNSKNYKQVLQSLMIVTTSQFVSNQILEDSDINLYFNSQYDQQDIVDARVNFIDQQNKIPANNTLKIAKTGKGKNILYKRNSVIIPRYVPETNIGTSIKLNYSNRL